jgi:hypothetical protein
MCACISIKNLMAQSDKTICWQLYGDHLNHDILDDCLLKTRPLHNIFQSAHVQNQFPRYRIDDLLMASPTHSLAYPAYGMPRYAVTTQDTAANSLAMNQIPTPDPPSGFYEATSGQPIPDVYRLSQTTHSNAIETSCGKNIALTLLAVSAGIVAVIAARRFFGCERY